MRRLTLTLTCLFLAACGYTPTGLEHLSCESDVEEDGRRCVDGFWVAIPESNNQPVNNQPVNNQPVNNQPVNNQPVNNQPVNNPVCEPADMQDFCGIACGELSRMECDVLRTEDCGPCMAPLDCVENMCVCPASSPEQVCMSAGLNCGEHELMDPVCQQLVTVDCGSCPGTGECDEGVCTCPETDQEMCARLNGCGLIVDEDVCGLQRQVQCGMCEGIAICGHLEVGVCDCNPADACAASECGPAPFNECPGVDCGSCGDHGSCQSGTCDCDTGYEYDPATGECVDIDECAEGLDNCSEFATCTNLVGSFECTCNQGFFGNGVTCVGRPAIVEFVEGEATGSSLTTAALGAGANALYLAAVSIRTEQRQVQSVSGLGLTWTEVATVCNASNNARLSLWMAQGNGSAGSVSVTLTGTPFNQLTTVYRIEAPGDSQAPAILNQAILNSSGGTSCSSSNATSTYSHTLNASDSAGLVFHWLYHRRNHVTGMEWQQIYQRTWFAGTRTNGKEVLIRSSNGQDIPVAGTFDSNENWVSIALEISP